MAAGTMLAAAAMLWPLVVLVPPTAVPSPAAVVSTLVLAVGSTAAALVLYCHLIRSVGPVKTMTVNFLSPLFGVTASLLLLGERLTWPLVAGGALILGGLALVLRSR
jgi:drug/metabolite transporter (DMT)-like permease